MVRVILPSILAGQAEGRQCFDVEAATVGEALRALPVADLLVDEQGEWGGKLNVFVDDRNARELGGPACPLAGVREVMIVAMLYGG